MRKNNGNQIKIIEEGISSFYEKIQQNNIKSVDILSQSIVYKDLSSKIYTAVIPKQAQNLLEAELRKANVNFSYKNSFDITSGLIIFLLWAVFGFLFYMFFKNDMNGKMDTNSKPVKPITFADVVGLEESKRSLQEVIDYMSHPEKYN
jgi:cell division protease FtsH